MPNLRLPDVSAEQKKHARRLVRALAKAWPDVSCALYYNSPWELLVATILSAQCTDDRVNATTPALFEAWPTAEELAHARPKHVERIIHSLGFFRSKAASLIGMSQAVVEDHGGEIPQDIDQLVKLPGVGRKTASVVLGTWFGIPAGVVVDTHVRRISGLLGLTQSRNPDIIERDLMAMLPKKEWIDFSHRLIHHGRGICIARRPKCTECPLLKLCPRTGLPPLKD